MPIYEFKCLDCHLRFEKLILHHQTEPITCPACSHGHVEKQLSVCKVNLRKGDTATHASSTSTSCSTCH